MTNPYVDTDPVLRRTFGGLTACSLAPVVAGLKGAVTRRVRAELSWCDPFWQRNYYEHVVRDEAELDRIREYIAVNPLRWAFDRENPDAPDGRRR